MADTVPALPNDPGARVGNFDQAIADVERALVLAPAEWKQRANAEMIRDELRRMRKRD